MAAEAAAAAATAAAAAAAWLHGWKKLKKIMQGEGEKKGKSIISVYMNEIMNIDSIGLIRFVQSFFFKILNSFNIRKITFKIIEIVVYRRSGQSQHE